MVGQAYCSLAQVISGDWRHEALKLKEGMSLYLYMYMRFLSVLLDGATTWSLRRASASLKDAKKPREKDGKFVVSTWNWWHRHPRILKVDYQLFEDVASSSTGKLPASKHKPANAIQLASRSSAMADSPTQNNNIEP